MTTEKKIKASKAQLCAALAAFIGQRSGIDGRNYGSRESLMGDYLPILRRGRQARAMLRAVELRDSITADNLIAACRAYSGRLQFEDDGKGGVRVDYCTGQYFPTEYRAAACAVLAQCMWDFWSTECNGGDWVRQQSRRELGRGIAAEWFR